MSTVFRTHAHHAGSSGYPRFVDRLDAFVDVRRPRPWRLPSPLLKRASSRIVYEWFGPAQLGLDLTAGRRLVTGRREIVHLLYGETDHYYAGRLRRVGHRRGNRLLATFHQPPALLDELVPAPPLFEQLDHAIALGPKAESHLAALIGSDRVSRAFLGVDTIAWHPRPAERASFPTCSFVGSWFRDFALFEDVVRLVHRAEPRVRFEAVTAPGRLEALSALPGVRARANVSDVELRRVYWRSWVNVLPLGDAVGNNALLEGMASGLATVVTDVGDVADYTGADGAELVASRDPEGMAEAVLALLADGDARERLGQRGRARAESRDLSAAARRHAEIYRRAAAA